MQVSAYQRRAHNACPDPEITLWVVDGFGGLVSKESYRNLVDRREQNAIRNRKTASRNHSERAT